MTVVCVLALKGSPGVTTLSCLLAATWPVPGPVTVVEADPAGGDLAARFALSSTVGWPSLEAAVRRGGAVTPLAPHLQHLPGGLPVLVGAQGDHVSAGSAAARAVVREAPGLVVVDLGRVAPQTDGPAVGWLRSCDGALLVVPGESAAALHARTHAAALLEATVGRLGLVAVGGGAPTGAEIGSFAGIRHLGDVPVDPAAAAVASGGSGAGRRLERSRLLASVGRIAGSVAGLVESEGTPDWGDASHDPARVSRGPRAGRTAAAGRAVPVARNVGADGTDAEDTPPVRPEGAAR